MRTDQLLDAIGNLDDGFLEESRQEIIKRKRMRSYLVRIASAAAACLVITFATHVAMLSIPTKNQGDAAPPVSNHESGNHSAPPQMSMDEFLGREEIFISLDDQMLSLVLVYSSDDISAYDSTVSVQDGLPEISNEVIGYLLCEDNQVFVTKDTTDYCFYQRKIGTEIVYIVEFDGKFTFFKNK